MCTWNSLQNSRRWFCCILKCCTLSENTVAQVFSSISTKHRKPYLVKVIKLITADSTLSLLWSYLQNWANDDQKQLPAPISTFCCQDECKNFDYWTTISSLLVYMHLRDRNCSLSIFVKIFKSIISSWSRWSCCLINPIPQAAVQTHMQVLVVPSSI